jgi:arylsulfatase A-like enzyme
MRTGRAARKNLGVTGRRAFLLSGLLGRLGMLTPVFGQASRRRPNVLLIVAGVWRAQAVPWAADTDDDVEAPNLKKLSRQAVAFSRAYSCSPRLRALPCLLRGVFPHTLLGMDATLEALLAESPSLGPVLFSAGYRVGVFKVRQADEIVSFVHAPGNRTGDQPFFAEWIFENSGGGGGLIERRPPGTLHVRENVPPYAEAAARTDLRTFYARAGASDRDIGEVLEALGEPGDALYENTIVVFTSLHGEQFGSHGESGDDMPYEESARIPLLIRYPRALPRAGASDMLVSQVDLAPTLLKWCGVPVPETVQGRDLSELMTGPGTDLGRPDAIYAEGRLGRPDEWRMLVVGYDKLVTDTQGNATQLFNLAEDPYETVNLARAAGSLLKRDELLAQQRVWMKRLEDGVDASGLKKR